MPLERLPKALNQLVQEEPELFVFGVNERSMTHKLAEYLQPLFPGWHVDCEYNRKGHDNTKTLHLPIEGTKTDDTEARTVFPDIIVHRRGGPENLLVVEVKKSTNRAHQFDLQKLEAFVEQLGYQYAAFVELIVGEEPDYKLRWIHKNI
jgi:hypothetical protein